MSFTKTYIRQIDGKWYAFEGDVQNNQVLSLGSDNPPPTLGSRYIARWTDKGIKYVSSPSRSRAAAIQRAKKHGDFQGEL